VIFDNYCNSRPQAIRCVEEITGKRVPFVRGDIRDRIALEAVLAEYGCDAVLHFAGLKAVGESVTNPLAYYDNNVVGTLRLLEAMVNSGVRTLVFSSSATVYGQPQYLPIDEAHPLSATNPYGRTKLAIEEMLRELHQADPEWRIAILRYFNPVGAHPSGMIGEDPLGIPNNLMPYVAQVAAGLRERLSIWGADYPTNDGTGVRDYIHVADLASGHLHALQCLTAPQCFAINLGTGIGYSVLEVVNAFRDISGSPIPYEIAPRRPGDIAVSYTDPGKAHTLLGWRAKRNLEQMCEDAWRWQRTCRTIVKQFSD
jgi:UDP-glucose 4-epimerase